MAYIIAYSGVFPILLAVIVLIIVMLQPFKFSGINSLIDSEEQANFKVFKKNHR